MATIKEIKAELGRRGVEYPAKARKAELEALLAAPLVEKVKPEKRKPGFIDPNADPATQA